jgi:cyclopropane fatty-acyl-phospholipid synthase-like methyltransferase
MADRPVTWTETDTEEYRALAPIAVPAREEQIAALLTLLPFGRHDAFRVVELGSGEGRLAWAILDCFPHASVVALDGSEAMRAHAAARLSPFGDRATVRPFELASEAWLDDAQRADAVVSSLCVHHLDDGGKRRMFAAVARRLSTHGALLIADLIAPQRPEAQELFAATWDRSAEAQSLAMTGGAEGFNRFVAARWNLYRFPDPIDQPSSLFAQLKWLEDAGFAVVDCFWLQAGHAIYGGYMNRQAPAEAGVTFLDALRSARATLRR